MAVPRKKANNIFNQYRPPALDNAVLRLSAKARRPNVGINLDILRQQVQTWVGQLQANQARLMARQYPQPGLNRPMTPPAPPAVPPVKPLPPPAPPTPTDWRAQNAGVVGPLSRPPAPTPAFKRPGAGKGMIGNSGRKG